MHGTTTQPTIAADRSETSALRQRQQAVQRPTATALSAAFAEQPTLRRLTEWAAALDFPLDFQI